MTVFFDSRNEFCAEMAKAFDFFADGNLESICSGNSKTEFAEDQIGFVIAADSFEALSVFLSETNLNADYFFAVILEEASEYSPKKTLAFFEKFGISLKYLNFSPAEENARKRADSAIRFRSDAGLFVEKIQEIPLKSKFSTFISSFSKKKSENSDEDEENPEN